MPLLAKPFPDEMTTPINLEGNKKMSVEASSQPLLHRL